jgi:hypothetical protein
MTALDDPIQKAEAVVRSGAPYLLGIQGYALAFPGVDDPGVVQRIGYRIMEGTTDAIKDESCRRYRTLAIQYAGRFNRRIVELAAEPN